MKTPIYLFSTLLVAQIMAQEPKPPVSEPTPAVQPVTEPTTTPAVEPTSQANVNEASNENPQVETQAQKPPADATLPAENAMPTQAETTPKPATQPTKEPSEQTSEQPPVQAQNQSAPQESAPSPAASSEPAKTTVSTNSAGGASASVSKDGTTASVNGSGGVSVNSGSLSVGLMELNGESVTRLSYRPELEFGKLGIALDIELFIDSDGNFKKDGWEFDTQNQILNSIYRKIYYIRWDKPGAPFYAKVGALEGLNFDAAGLIMNNWGNIANYPSQKLLGVHTQINESITPFAISLDAATNSILDWNNGGGVIALKAGFAPINSLPIPVLSNLRLQGTYVSDMNQKAGVLDRDGDGCPDDLDFNTNKRNVCSNPGFDVSQIIDLTDQEKLDAIDEFYSEVLETDSTIINNFRQRDAFTLVGLEYLLPIWNNTFSSLNVFGEYAQPLFATKKLEDSRALVPLGASGHVSFINWGLQYRILEGRFNPGHFDAAYEMQRTVFTGTGYVSKEQVFWEQDLGYREGVYGTLGANLWNLLELGGSYSQLVSHKKIEGQTIPDDIAYSATAGIGQTVLSYIPKVSKAEVFFSKLRVRQDTYTLNVNDENGQFIGAEEYADSFFGKSIYTAWGFTIGSDLGGGLQLNITRTTTFDRIYNQDRTEARLSPTDNFYAETVLSF